MSKSTIRADEILQVLQRRHQADLWITEVKDGPSTMVRTSRMDGLAIKRSWTHPRFVGYEVKVSRSDFLRDNKWDFYLPLTHQFSFACPWDLIQPDELPSVVGLYWVNPEDGKLKQVRKPVLRPMQELPTWLLYYVVISRLEPDRHPFFPSTREYITAFVEDKAERWALGSRFKTRLTQEVARLEKENEDLRARLHQEENQFARLERALKAVNLPADGWNLQTELMRLRESARVGMDRDALLSLQISAEKILDAVARLGKEGAEAQ